MSILIGLPLTLLSELTRNVYHTVPSILIASVLGVVVFTRLSSRAASNAHAIQVASATAAFLSGTLRIAFGQGQPFFVVKAILYSVFTFSSVLTFLLPVAVAVLAGSHFENTAAPSRRRVFTLCVVVGLGTIVHVRWSQGLWQNPLLYFVPGLCTYIAVMILSTTLSHRPISSGVDGTKEV